MERRNTIQKELILNAVIGMHRHVTADEVYEFIRSEYPTIGKGTVYRNLSLLAEEGKISRVEIPNGADCFDYRVQKHYHLRCLKCGKVVDVEMDAFPKIGFPETEEKGMLFTDYDVFFKGICPECMKKEK